MVKVRHLPLVLLLIGFLCASISPTDAAPQRPAINLNNISRLQKVRILGKGDLGEIKWSPDGKTLAVGSTTGVWLYDTSDFKREPRWLGSRDFQAMHLIFSPDGKKLVSYNRLTKISMWDVASGQVEQEISLGLQGFMAITNTGSGVEYAPIYDVSFTSAGQLLVTSALPLREGYANPFGSNDGFHVWDAFSKKDVVIYKEHPGISSVTYSPDGKTLTFGIAHDLTEPGEVQLLSLGTGEKTATLTGPQTPVNSVAYSLDGRYIGSGGGAVPSDYADDKLDNTGRIWDAKSGKLLFVLEGHDYWVEKVAFSPNSQLLATGSGDNTVRLWTVANGKLKVILRGHTGWIKDVAFSPDNRWIASASGDGSVRIWDVERGKKIAEITGFAGNSEVYVGPGSPGSGFDYAFGPDNASIGAVLGGNTLKIWNALDGKEMPISPIIPTGISAAAQLKAFVHPQIATIWQDTFVRTVLTPEDFFRATFSPNLKYLLVSMVNNHPYSRKVELWSLDSLKKVADLPYDTYYDVNLVFSPASLSVVYIPISQSYVYLNTEIIFIDPATGLEQLRYTRPAFNNASNFAVKWRFSADGKLLGIMWADGYISIIGSFIGLPFHLLDLRPASIYRGDFSSTMDQVVYTVSREDHTPEAAYGWRKESTEIYDFRNQKTIHVLGTALRFAPDDRVVFTVEGNKLWAWNAETGQLLKMIESRSLIEQVQISPDNTLLTIANDDDVIEVWAIAPEVF